MPDIRLKTGSVVAITLVLLAAKAALNGSAEDLPVCDAKALAAVIHLPPPAFRCEDSDQYCSTDKGMRWDEPECRSATTAYEKTLKGLLTARWWASPAASLEACRVHGQVGALTRQETGSLNQGLGPQVQGTDRVRMLVIGETCEGSAGLSNLFLAVRTGNSVALTALYYAFNQGGTEAPFSLDVAVDRLGTFALFTSQGHDMQSAYSTTTAYKIDPATGHAALYPLFLTARGASAMVGQSEPISSELNFKDSGIVSDGRLVRQFLSYTDHLCQPDNDRCQPVTTTRFAWNGTWFVEDGYQTKRKEYVARLARQRECIRRKFDPKKGTADCPADLDCPRYNDLSMLNLKAGNLTEARNYAESALDSCRSNFIEFKAAQYNYRQSHKAR